MVAISSVLSTFLVISVPAFANAAPDPINSLFTRQTNAGSMVDPSAIPSACRESCTNIQKNTMNCTDLKCLCSDKVVEDMGSCLNCAVGVSNSQLNATYAQSIADSYVDSCKRGDITVKPIKISGSSSKGSSSSATRLSVVGTTVLAALAFAVTLL